MLAGCAEIVEGIRKVFGVETRYCFLGSSKRVCWQWIMVGVRKRSIAMISLGPLLQKLLAGGSEGAEKEAGLRNCLLQERGASVLKGNQGVE